MPLRKAERTVGSDVAHAVGRMPIHEGFGRNLQGRGKSNRCFPKLKSDQSLLSAHEKLSDDVRLVAVRDDRIMERFKADSHWLG